MMLLSHPTGNNFVREATMALWNAGLLGELHLGIAACGDNAFSRLARLPGMSEIRRRSYDAQLQSVLHLHPWRELGRLAANRFGIGFLLRHERGVFCVDSVYQDFDRRVASAVTGKTPKLSAVYAYEDGALQTFRRAKSEGMKCVYDLPIAHWRCSRRLLDEEAERCPEWEPTLVGTRDSPAKCERKDAELELADVVICPSDFVKSSLLTEIDQAKPVHVIPFGSPVTRQRTTKRTSGPLKVLFAGSMTQRKGLADVFAAMRLLDPQQIELHVIGSPVVRMDFYRNQFSTFTHHSSRSNERVLELMQSMDCLVLPSIVEGRALVQQEAMACGLPIIVTNNAGAGDLVEDGKAGFLVPIRDPAAIAQCIETLQRDRDLLRTMSIAAKEKAAEITWENYRHQLADCVGAAISG